jgi:hypothetical protein
MSQKCRPGYVIPDGRRAEEARQHLKVVPYQSRGVSHTKKYPGKAGASLGLRCMRCRSAESFHALCRPSAWWSADRLLGSRNVSHFGKSLMFQESITTGGRGLSDLSGVNRQRDNARRKCWLCLLARCNISRGRSRRLGSRRDETTGRTRLLSTWASSFKLSRVIGYDVLAMQPLNGCHIGQALALLVAETYSSVGTAIVPHDRFSRFILLPLTASFLSHF